MVVATETSSNATDDVAGEPTEATETQEPTVSIIGEDGKFSEGWKNLLPEDIRGEKSLTHTDIQGLARSFIDTKRMVGKDKIAIPNENSSQAEWDAFYEAGGKPKEPTDYKLEAPTELADYIDDDLMTSAKELFHKIGISQKQAELLFEFDNQRIKKGIEHLELEKEDAKVKAEDALKKKWGAEYEPRLHNANRMIAENVNAEHQEEILEVIGNNPLVADFLANIASKFMEAKIMTPEPALSYDIQAQINEIVYSKDYTNPNINIRQPLIDKVQRLFAQKAALQK